MFQPALLQGRILQALEIDDQWTIGRCYHHLALCLVRQCELQGDDLGLRPKPRVGDIESATGQMHFELNLNGPAPFLAITAGQIILPLALDAIDAGVFEQDRGSAGKRKAVEANVIVAIHGDTKGAFLPPSHRPRAHYQKEKQSTSRRPRQGGTPRMSSAANEQRVVADSEDRCDLKVTQVCEAVDALAPLLKAVSDC